MNAAPRPSAMHCEDPPIAFGGLLRRAPEGGLPGALEAALPGRRVALCANARAGIRAACDLFGIGAGDAVLAPDYNCGSEIDALLASGAEVALHPVGPDLVADPGAIAARLTPRVKAIYVIHYFGIVQPRMAEIRDLARGRGVRLIEDCALALGAEGPDGPAGSFGDAAAFCFYKFFPLIAGGALVVPEDAPAPVFDRPLPGRFAEKAALRALARRALGGEGLAALKRRLGRGGADAPAEAAADGLPDMPADYYFDPGFRRARMSGITRRLLASCDLAAAARVRRRNHALLAGLIAERTGARLMAPALSEAACPLILPVLVRDRDRICAALQARRIAATPWWAGYHRGLDWTGRDGARFLKDHGLGLPIHQFLSEDRIRWMAEEVAALDPVAPAAMQEAGA